MSLSLSWRYRLGLVLALCLLAFCAACGNGSGSRGQSQGTGAPTRTMSDAVGDLEQHPRPTSIVIPSQHSTPTSTPTPKSTAPAQSASKSAQVCGATAPATGGALPTTIAATGKGSAPYGQPPALTSEEIMLTQKLFQQINQDRAACGLPPFVWNATLSGGARLHSWNMYHCGFSHTCPDGLPQCTRIANEGFTFSDCGENIGLAGPYPTPWGGVYSIQAGMANEPASGWHHIHLFSTTLHQIGIGVYVAPNGWIWFTEDMIS
ncbi:CAP domain-containing protein [Thermogemmatispora sp.]|uniref:CAP domain-containing protein n=1 Tax=Thermogemmatispora sp. TaxID=1968838 RepID=UPI0035E45DBA